MLPAPTPYERVALPTPTAIQFKLGKGLEYWEDEAEGTQVCQCDKVECLVGPVKPLCALTRGFLE